MFLGLLNNVPKLLYNHIGLLTSKFKLEIIMEAIAFVAVIYINAPSISMELSDDFIKKYLIVEKIAYRVIGITIVTVLLVSLFTQIDLQLLLLVNSVISFTLVFT